MKNSLNSLYPMAKILAVALTIILLGGTGVMAQAPVVTCPGTISLTLNDIGTVKIEVPITGADVVVVDSTAGSWVPDTVILNITMPISQTYTVIASTAGFDTTTCDIIIDFPGVTTKSGTIDVETWTTSESPYCVVGDLRVANLVIEPGVDVVFYGNYVCEVTGRIIATGNAVDSIAFAKADNITGWQGIFFNISQPGSMLTYCNISGSIYSGVRIDNSIPLIQNCRVFNNTANYGGGIYASGTTEFNLDQCVIEDNRAEQQGIGLYIISDSIKITNCIIQHNIKVTNNKNGYGGGVFASGNLEMADCLIRGNSVYTYTCIYGSLVGEGGGIRLTGNLQLTNCHIDSNYVGVKNGPCSGANANGYTRGGGIYVNGNSEISNCIVKNNTLYVYAQRTVAREGAGVYFTGSGNSQITNSTIIKNNYAGLHSTGVQAEVLNCIFWENGSQVAGNVSLMYSCVEGADTTGGNPRALVIDNPSFYDVDSLTLTSLSPCIDAGDPDGFYNDCEDPENSGMALLPSRGTTRNDIGVYGGPLTCITDSVKIICPVGLEFTSCDLEEICINLRIYNANNVTTDKGTWSNNQFCFTPTEFGQHVFGVIAENSVSADTCSFSIMVTQSVPIQVSTSRALFAMTDVGVLPAPKMIQVDSPCDSGSLNWQATILNGSWLRLDKMSGTNPDSIEISIVDDTLPAGIYGATIALNNTITNVPTVIVDVTLFVIDGVDVGTVITKPGNLIAIPITINTNNQNPDDSVTAFTIPLRYNSIQYDKVIFDSLVFDNKLLFNGVIIIKDPATGLLIADRPIDDPPLPDSAYDAYAWFSIDSLALPEVVRIDLTDTTINSIHYTYQYVLNTGDTTVPSFSPGAIVIGDPDPTYPSLILPDSATEAIGSIRPVNICVPVTAVNADQVLVGVMNGDASNQMWNNNNLCFDANSNGYVEFLISASNIWGSVSASLGVAIVDDSWTDVNEDGNALPVEFDLGQNYPNPFNPKTVINFAIPKASLVSIDVFNIVGQRVTTLVNQELPAGYYTVDWDSTDKTGRSVASGIYFYRIQTDSFVETKKMLLLK